LESILKRISGKGKVNRSLWLTSYSPKAESIQGRTGRELNRREKPKYGELSIRVTTRKSGLFLKGTRDGKLGWWEGMKAKRIRDRRQYRREKKKEDIAFQYPTSVPITHRKKASRTRDLAGKWQRLNDSYVRQGQAGRRTYPKKSHVRQTGCWNLG